MKIQIVPVGGRIKSAAVGLDMFSLDARENMQEKMRKLRKDPPRKLLEAFFPSDRARLRQMMEGVGFYRPTLKTDQGMGGNFLPFYIDLGVRETNFSVRKIVKEEGLIIPESYLEHNPGILQELRETFQKLDFRDTYRILEPLLTQSREAEKGRTPFFFIRPAQLSSPIVFGHDVMEKVTREVEVLLGRVEKLATEKAGQTLPDNFLYFLADVFVTTDGEVVVEKLYFPDVGFFMTELPLDGSIAREVQEVVRGIQGQVFEKALGRVCSRVVYIVTRDEVLERREDVLEILEIKSISRKFCAAGIAVEVKGVSQVGEIPAGAICLLLNINAGDAVLLLERYGRGELICYPSPYLQMASRELSGLTESIVPSQFMEKFLGLIGCNPKDDYAAEGVVSQIDASLSRHGGITSELLHVEVNGREIVPVHRRIHHSWKRLANRVDDPSQAILKIREIPINARNSMVTSTTGPRLHSFRFTFTAD